MKKFINGKKYVFVFKKYKKSLRKLKIDDIGAERRIYKAKSEALGFKCAAWFDKANGNTFIFNGNNEEETVTQAMVNGEFFHRNWCKEVKLGERKF